MRNKVTIEHSCQIRALYQQSYVRGKKLLEMLPQYSNKCIYNHAKKPINGLSVFDKRKLNTGQPRKLNTRDERSITNQISKLRKQEQTSCSPHIQLESGVGDKVSNRTV